MGQTRWGMVYWDWGFVRRDIVTDHGVAKPGLLAVQLRVTSATYYGGLDGLACRGW
jgi:hypothetical protein